MKATWKDGLFWLSSYTWEVNQAMAQQDWQQVQPPVSRPAAPHRMSHCLILFTWKRKRLKCVWAREKHFDNLTCLQFWARLVHCGFLKNHFTQKLLLPFISPFPLSKRRKFMKRRKTVPCHHPPIYFFKPLCIYFCLISPSPIFLLFETEMLIRWGFPSRLSLVGLLPFQRSAPVPAKCYELQGKKLNQLTNLARPQNTDCVCRRNIFSCWGNTEFSQHWSR